MGAPYKDLIVWQRAVQLSVAVYKFTAGFPDSERFGLTNQLRRASVSVASNIAEGFGRTTKGEFKQFLGHARGSLYEVDTQMVIAAELKLGHKEQSTATAELASEVGKMLIAMMRKTQSD